MPFFPATPWTGGNLPARDPDPVSLAAKDTRAQWTDRWCHRSVYSWQIRTALDAALSDPHQSFTVLPYGCSGATIMDGVLYGYNGVEWSKATDKGVIGSRSEIGLAYQEICRPDAFRSYCASGASWCGRTDPPTPQQEQAPGFYDAAAPALRRAVMRCGPKNVFKRSADALLIDIGINDVGFAGWAAGIILQDPILRSAAGAMTPCFDGTARCASTRSLFARLDSRYGLLRTVLDQYMLPDFGIDPSHVIVAVYPPALENERGVFCPQGNAGLTIATFPSRFPSQAPASGSVRADGGRARRIPCERSGRKGCRAGAGETERKPRRLRPAASGETSTSSTPIRPITPGVASVRRPTRKAVLRPARPVSRRRIFSICIARPTPKSMHVPRTGPLSSACPGDPAAFLPFPPGRFEPYRSRTRLFRTMNDVFLAINQRPQHYLDQSPFGVLDLSGRATGGAFHPTAEGHAIIANEATAELCQSLGCGH